MKRDLKKLAQEFADRRDPDRDALARVAAAGYQPTILSEDGIRTLSQAECREVLFASFVSSASFAELLAEAEARDLEFPTVLIVDLKGGQKMNAAKNLVEGSPHHVGGELFAAVTERANAVELLQPFAPHTAKQLKMLAPRGSCFLVVSTATGTKVQALLKDQEASE